MRIYSSLLMKLGGLSVAGLTRGWMGTLDYHGAHYDPSTDPGNPEFRGPAIFIFWHEYIPLLYYLRGNCRITMLLSQHQDAEWISQANRHMGFGTVRGSTNRGGIAALREMLRQSRSVNLTITPDGPRGPRRHMTPGAIFLSSRLGIPLVPVGVGYDRPWRVRSAWDQFAIPRPYSRGRMIVGPRVQIPSKLGRGGIERYRLRVEKLLNRITEACEEWAESGKRLRCQQPLRREGMPRCAPFRRAA
jgi:lysophospholipid acyltransferase (LPLAT)-like uncharacterized protein